ncbi:follicle cell protein 3C-1 [Thrips palmi]|uniref:Follicle cell protein 3C-1 n=1 Tax=Thrips palmi TaxID=161013 RepID=A0A6P8YQL5_THRPL|nr:follicle cell protein 3C-1 [Thrips palmi]
MHRRALTLVVVACCVCASLAVEEECTDADANAVPPPATTLTPSPRPPSTPRPSATAAPRAATATATATRRPRVTLAGVRPMKDRSNSTEPIPCTCGIFLTSQFKAAGQPTGTPAISHEFNRATPNTAAGIRQCTTACVDMIVKHLPNSSAIMCSSIERDCMREKAYLFIKNSRNKWLATRLSAGKEFCCKGGIAIKCPKK